MDVVILVFTPFDSTFIKFELNERKWTGNEEGLYDINKDDKACK